MIRSIIHASELITARGVRLKDGVRPQEEDLGTISDGAIVYEEKGSGKNARPGKILWLGPTSEIPKKYKRAKKLDLKKKRAVIPGMIDCHTHLVFAGDRSQEFALRCGGMSYQEIAQRGGGIQTTVEATRKATLGELVRLGEQRLREAYAFGVRTVEIKSGYGLNFETELKQLKAIQALRKKFPRMTLVSTFLGAHAFPKGKTRDEYIREILHKMLPEVSKQKLADACDVFVDEGYFTPEEAEDVLIRARELGLKIKLHGDELANTESAALAAKMGALSVDHLLRVSTGGIHALSQSQTVAVLLPGTAFYLKAEHAPARELIDAGVRVAISTDFNPGSSMCNSLPSILTIAALYLGMTRAELLASVTYNAARALGLHARKGTLEEGMDADFTVLPFERFEETYYRFSWAPSLGL